MRCSSVSDRRCNLSACSLCSLAEASALRVFASASAKDARSVATSRSCDMLAACHVRTTSRQGYRMSERSRLTLRGMALRGECEGGPVQQGGRHSEYTRGFVHPHFLIMGTLQQLERLDALRSRPRPLAQRLNELPIHKQGNASPELGQSVETIEHHCSPRGPCERDTTMHEPACGARHDTKCRGMRIAGV